MRRDSDVQQPRAARSPEVAGASAPRAPRRPPARQPALRLTRRGLVVLGALGLVSVVLVVLLVVAVVRLVGADPTEPAPAVAPVAVVPDSCVPDPTTSLNCWPAFEDGSDPRLEISPWVTGRLLGGDVRTVLEHVAARFDAEVEPVDPATSWGWGYRNVRGEVGDDELSNHSSGTAIDLNATEHPLGARDTFTDEQVAAIREILAEVAPVVAWGGDFARGDEMHFEIVGDPAAVAEVAARLRGEAPPAD
ncbi:M15 family metallopeptidase [Cellulomonas pakistanensis]|uniref:Peptidase M15C domain-containing protein n=1 Tax=Cellulomonas pakistanensis TaxID=992287 RepID=A0A919PFY2_9CELL|nr:M15 family metallopeptidase [Cellulomonas pakistanensis]GIG37807.1 hypothetical protein Cpa01nite_31880 [Cellulomonas pakistanensis]